MKSKLIASSVVKVLCKVVVISVLWHFTALKKKEQMGWSVVKDYFSQTLKSCCSVGLHVLLQCFQDVKLVATFVAFSVKRVIGDCSTEIKRKLCD